MNLLRLSVASAIGASLIALAACQSAVPVPVSTDESAVATYVYEYGMGSATGLVRGILDFDEGCVRIEAGPALVFPDAAVEWDGTALSLEGEIYHDGDRFVGAGGQYVGPVTSGVTIPATCEGLELIGIGPSRDFMRNFPSPEAAPCVGEFVADIDTSVPGSVSEVRAAEEWALHSSAPVGAPRDGWMVNKDGTVTRGEWTVGLTETNSGGWVVSGLDCTDSPGVN